MAEGVHGTRGRILKEALSLFASRAMTRRLCERSARRLGSRNPRSITSSEARRVSIARSWRVLDRFRWSSDRSRAARHDRRADQTPRPRLPGDWPARSAAECASSSPAARAAQRRSADGLRGLQRGRHRGGRQGDRRRHRPRRDDSGPHRPARSRLPRLPGEALTGYLLFGHPDLTPELADALSDTILEGWRHS